MEYCRNGGKAGQVRDATVLVATGITPEGERQILGVSVPLSEHKSHWKAFLKGGGMRHGVKLAISDDHEGLRAARRAVLGRDVNSIFSRMRELMYPNKP